MYRYIDYDYIILQKAQKENSDRLKSQALSNVQKVIQVIFIFIFYSGVSILIWISPYGDYVYDFLFYLL